jgi:hypothetical protein
MDNSDKINIEIDNYKAAKAIIMGLLLDNYIVRLFQRPDDYVIRTWRDKE